MARYFGVAFANGSQRLVRVEYHGVGDWRALVYHAKPRDTPCLMVSDLALATPVGEPYTQLHAMPSEQGAIAEAVCWLAAEHARETYVTEVVTNGHYFRDALISALTTGDDFVRERVAQAREESETLRAALDRANHELRLAVELAGQFARQRDERDAFVRALDKGKA